MTKQLSITIFRINTYEAACKCWALLTSSQGGVMPQAVEVVGQAEQEGLADLGGQAAPGAREESLRLTAEKMLSILERCRYGFFGKARNI